MRKELLKTVLLLITLTILLSSCKGSGNNSSGDNSNDPVVTVKHSEKEPVLAPEELIHKYYNLMSNRNTLKEAYELSTKKVDYEKFYSWYKDVKEVNVGEIESLGDDRYRFDIIMLETEDSYKFTVTMTISEGKIVASESKAVEEEEPRSFIRINPDSPESPFTRITGITTDEEAPTVVYDNVSYFKLGEGEGKDILIEKLEPVKKLDEWYNKFLLYNTGNYLILRDQESGEMEKITTPIAVGLELGHKYYAICKQNSAIYYTNDDGGIIKVLVEEIEHPYPGTEDEVPVRKYLTNLTVYIEDDVSIARDPNLFEMIYCGRSLDGRYYVTFNRINSNDRAGSLRIIPLSSIRNKSKSINLNDILSDKNQTIEFLYWSSLWDSVEDSFWIVSYGEDKSVEDFMVINYHNDYIKYNLSSLNLKVDSFYLNPDYGKIAFSRYVESEGKYQLVLYDLREEKESVISESTDKLEIIWADSETLKYRDEQGIDKEYKIK